MRTHIQLKDGKGAEVFQDLFQTCFGVATSQAHVEILEHIALPLCLKLMKNNLWTKNFSSFLEQTLDKVDAITSKPIDDVTE